MNWGEGGRDSTGLPVRNIGEKLPGNRGGGTSCGDEERMVGGRLTKSNGAGALFDDGTAGGVYPMKKPEVGSDEARQCR